MSSTQVDDLMDFLNPDPQVEPEPLVMATPTGWVPPQDLLDYLLTLISPPDERATYIGDLAGVDWSEFAQKADASLCGLIARGTPTEAQSKEFLRALKPGAHLLLIAPEEERWGSTGACTIEDVGFEIRDAILIADPPPVGQEDAPCHFHYTPKADRGERELGCHSLEGKAGAEAVGRQEGAAGTAHAAAGAGHGAKKIKNFHPCLHPDAEVMTLQGFRPISELTPGNQVFTADGTFHPVTHVTRHAYTSSELVRLSVQGTNYTTLASDNHPFLIWRPLRRGANLHGGEIGWFRADQVQKGDYTMTPIFKPLAETEQADPFWFVFGLYLAEGVIQKAGHGSSVYPSFTLHEKETDLVALIRAALGNTSVYPKTGSKGIQVVSFNAEAGRMCKQYGGCGSTTKSLAPEFWTRNRAEMEATFRGWMAGDGGKVRTWEQGKTVSPDLATQMHLLGEMLGYKSNLFHNAAPEGKGIGNRKFKTTSPYYTLQFFGRNLGQSTRKPSRPTTVEYEGTIFSLRHVKKVERVPYQGDVCNLSVEGSPTFQTAIGMSHNTVKPVELMVKLLRDVPKGPDIPPPPKGAKASDVLDPYQVLDPFLGSGSTGLGCMETQHSFRGMDREADYVQIATSRAHQWKSATGKKGDRKGLRLGDDAPVYHILSDVVTEEEKPTMDLNALFGFDDDES